MTEAEGRQQMGSGGHCICPRCEVRVPHRQGVRCQDERCPTCEGKMLREGSHHHELWLAKHQSAETEPRT